MRCGNSRAREDCLLREPYRSQQAGIWQDSTGRQFRYTDVVRGNPVNCAAIFGMHLPLPVNVSRDPTL